MTTPPLPWRALATAGALVILAWTAVHGLRPLDFWSTPDDYAAHSLSHALNLEQALAENTARRIGYFQYIHPGLPFQFVSWLDFRVAQLFTTTDSKNPVLSTLANPGGFWLANRVSALGLLLAGLATAWCCARRLDGVTALVAALVFLSFQPAWTHTVLRLGNESFALLLGAGLFGLLLRAFAGEQCLAGPWVIVGLLAGTAYLMKMNYVTWIIAAAIGLLTALVCRRGSVRPFVGRAALLVAGFAGGVVVLGVLALGTRGMHALFREQRRILFHSGRYGGGDPEIFDEAAVAEAVRDIAANLDLWLVPLCLAIITILVVASRRKDRAWLKSNLPFVAGCGAAMVLGYAAAIKHFRPHYLVPVAAVLPALVTWIGESVNARVRRFVAGVVALSILLAGGKTWREYSGNLTHAAALREDCRRIEQLPLAASQVRVWARVNSPAQIASTVILWSNTGSTYQPVLQTLYPHDALYEIWDRKVYYQGQLVPPETVPWQYAILDRRRFPDFESVPACYRDHGTELPGYQAVVVVARTNPGITPL